MQCLYAITMSKSSHPLKKRPFQPSVDSYFHHASKEINSLGVTLHHDSTAVPKPPPAIQSSLLNVGMRVRKSVPEGYKTCAKSQSHSSIDAENRHRSGIEPWRLGTAARPRELMPYCGILHVGGHENQPVEAENDLAPLEFVSDASDLMSSQEFATSMSIAPVFPSPRNKKRPLDDLSGCWELQPVTSPLCPIGVTRLNRLQHKLQPKSAMRRHLFTAEQECERIDVDDFEEATFLRPKD